MTEGSTRSYLAGLAGFLIAFGAFWAPAVARNWLDVPTGTDAVAYVDIAIQVARGSGLREGADTPTIDALLPNASLFKAPPPASGPVPSTRWPPLWPIVMGAVFRFWGFNLGAARTANCAAMAAACGVVAAILARRRGWGPAVIFIVLFAVVDERLRENARVLMTEPLATLLVCVSAALLMGFARSGRASTVAAAGAVTGLAILARTAVFLWLPGLTILVVWLAVRFAALGFPRAAALGGLFATTAILVCTPWFIHNIRALQAFMPLGSHVSTLPSGFSDQAWAKGGVWYSLGPGFFAGVTDPDDPPLVVARKQAVYGREKALEWIQAHPVKAVVLGGRKALALWVPNRSIEMAYLIFPLLGLILLGRSPESAVIGGFLLFNTLAVAATWTWEGDRFQVPLLGLLHYAGSLGIWQAVRTVSQARGDAMSTGIGRSPTL